MSTPSWDELDERDDTDDPADDEVTDTVVCRHCGADVYEEADQCPVCGMYLLADTSPWSNKPAAWIALGLLGILATILALLFGL